MNTQAKLPAYVIPHWNDRVVLGDNWESAVNPFSTPEDARTATALANAAYEQGRRDKAKELRRALNISDTATQWPL